MGEFQLNITEAETTSNKNSVKNKTFFVLYHLNQIHKYPPWLIN